MEKIQPYAWGHSRRYNDFPTFFRSRFTGRVQKISVDGGFTCPNRDGTKGVGGCTYCNNESFKPTHCDLEFSITNQLQNGIDFYARKYESMRFIAYFQAYTNTYASIEVLKSLYQEALSKPEVIGLVIATRPDCLDGAILDYLEELSKDYYIMIELGVESHLDRTLSRIHRGHTFSDSARAIEEISRRGLSNCIHVILGLPGESREDQLEQARIISQLPVDNIKLHQLQIHKNTVMLKQYLENPELFNLYDSPEEYVEMVVDYLEYLNPAIVVERFVSESPSELLIAPRWGIKNFEFVVKVERRLEVRKTWQGRMYK